MSKNFELLRRARKGQALFIQAPASWPDVSEVPPCSNEETVQTEDTPDRKRYPHRVLPGRGWGGAAQDEINKLVLNVFVFPNSDAPRAVSFSSVEGNGSSQICLHAAESLASHGSKSVCLVDANLYAPSLHRMLGVAEFPGLTDTLTDPLTDPGPVGENAVLIGPGKLWLLPSGSPVSEVQGLFASDRLGSRISKLKEQFDFVLIDLPPVCGSADAVLLGRMTDGVILVLEANSTRRETARMAKQTLEDANVRLLGAILNNRTFPIPEFLYRKL